MRQPCEGCHALRCARTRNGRGRTQHRCTTADSRPIMIDFPRHYRDHCTNRDDRQCRRRLPRDWTQCEARGGGHLRAFDRTCGRRIRVRLAHDFGPLFRSSEFSSRCRLSQRQSRQPGRQCARRLLRGGSLRRNIFGQSCAINRVPKHCGRCSSCTAFGSLVWHFGARRPFAGAVGGVCTPHRIW